ncbi:MAG TPA: hypothetical protein VMR21_09265 [Vicinamibacteria bacterium]|nr:hypothetical protein [Vicinamibacteria bacterium]
MASLVLAAVLAGGAGRPSAPEPVVAHYHVIAEAGARALRVEARFEEPPAGGLIFEDGMGRHARDVEVARGRSWSPVAVAEDALVAPPCARGCRVRYRFRLDEAARAARERRSAFEQEGAFVAAPSAWLLRPWRHGPGRYRLAVETPPGVSFATGLFASPGGAYEAPLVDLPEAPYSAFGPLDRARVRVGGGEVEVAILPGPTAVGRAAVLAWVEAAAADVAAYYGRLPVPRVLVLVVPGGRRPVGYGTTMGNGGASIMIWLGPGARAEDLRRDWVLTHEMVHLGLPNVPRAERWLEEGLATYVEPVARARRGRLRAEEVWGDLVRRTPQGLPGPGGLEANRGFGPVYWGGALFWLLADVEIRERTAGRRTLQDALRGVGEKGGSIAVTWDAARLLSTADEAVGVDVLVPLHARLARAAGEVDLPALWARLGIEDQGGIRFHDEAPLAAVRRAITLPSAPEAAAPTPRP